MRVELQPGKTWWLDDAYPDLKFNGNYYKDKDHKWLINEESRPPIAAKKAGLGWAFSLVINGKHDLSKTLMAMNDRNRVKNKNECMPMKSQLSCSTISTTCYMREPFAGNVWVLYEDNKPESPTSVKIDPI